MADRLVARDSGGAKFEPHPAGSFGMRCVDVIDLGEAVAAYPGRPASITYKCALVFASGKRHESGDMILVTQEYTLSMHEKAKLRQHLEAWRGKPYTEEQAKLGVPVDKLEGQEAMIVIGHRVSAKGRTYATISGIGPVPDGMIVKDTADYQRPDFFAQRKEENRRAVAAFRAAEHTAYDDEPASDAFPPIGDQDECPF
jgi:hypothetical protein